MLALRRVALRALSSTPSVSTISAPARSLSAIRATSFRNPHTPLATRIPRRWMTEEAQRSQEGQPASDPDPSTAPLRSEPLAEEAQEAAQTSLQPGLEEEPGIATRKDAFTPSFRRNPLNLPPSNTIYVGNLFYDVTEADLRREFDKVAPVQKVSIAFDRRGLSKGHGYIEYESVEDARRAIDELNNQVFEGRRMVVNFRAPVVAPRPNLRSRASEPTRTLFIGNMSYEMTDQDLNDLFRDIRNVIDVRVAIDRRTGTPKGFAHADFTDVESAERAARILERKRLYGRQLRVDYSTTNNIREPTESDYTQPQEQPEKESP